MTTSTPLRDLLHAANLQHGTDGFTSPPKEGMLRIFLPLKIRRLRPDLNPRTWVLKDSTLPLDHLSRSSIVYKTIIASHCYSARSSTDLPSGLYTSNFWMKSLASGETLENQSSLNSYFPSFIRVNVSRSLAPLKGESPESSRYVIIPTDHMSAASPTPSPFTTSGATNSGMPAI